MSYITTAHKGLEAAQKKNWTEAINLLSDALQHSENPAWLLARSQAYQETNQHLEALWDADHAFFSAMGRQESKGRDQMILAQYRRAVNLGHLKRYADADACCVWSQQLIAGKNFRREADTVTTHVDADGNYLATPEEALSTSTLPERKPGDLSMAKSSLAGGSEWTRAYVWRSMMLRQMQKLPKDDPARKITVLRVPKRPVRTLKPEAEKPSTPAPPAPSLAKPAPKKLRVDFYQTSSDVNLVLYAKDADKDKLKIDVHDSEIHLNNMPEATIGSTRVVLDLNRMVDSSADKTINVTRFKIELTLKKKVPGEKWGVWGSQRDASSDGLPPLADMAINEVESTQSTQPAVPAVPAVPAAPAASSPEKKPTAAAASGAGPAYPSSSRTGPKNWDAIEDGDDEPESDVNAFFKKLYANSTPEQQRAMSKSFIESNGTALSTDWNSVKTGEVATLPPDGTEAKKWN